MNLQDYLQRAEVEQPMPRPAMEVFDSTEPTDLSEPLSQHRPALRLTPFEDLVGLVVQRYRWLALRARVAAIEEELGDEALGLDVLARALFPDEASSWARARLAGDLPVQEALHAIWKLAMGLALEKSFVTAKLTQARHPRAAQYQPMVGDQPPLAELEHQRWLELKRGVRSNVLALSWTHPVDEIAESEAVAEHLPALAELVGRRKPKTFIKEAIVEHLDTEVGIRFGMQVEETVVAAAGERYKELLLGEPLKLAPLGSVYVGTDKQRLGLCVLDKRGATSATAPIRPSGTWAARVVRWMRDHRAKIVALPERAVASKWLTELREALDEAAVKHVPVDIAGIVEARAIDDPVLRRVSTEEASAIVLARRAVRPIDEWCRVDPVRLGLAPLQTELNADRLRELMQVVRERCIAATTPLSTAPVTSGGIRGRSSAPLNPTVSSIRDLRPGLQLNGVITNVTKFGAFVNLGLRQEGLIHISELSDEFVNDPHDVVQQGQRISCRVISVDLDRGRIALSMRTEGSLGPRRDGDGPPRRGPPGKRGGPTGAERSRVLADLESLFRK